MPEHLPYTQHSFHPRITAHLKKLLQEGFNLEAGVVLHMLFKENLEAIRGSCGPLKPWVITYESLWRYEYFYDSFQEVLEEMSEHELITYTESGGRIEIRLANYGEDLVRGAYGPKAV